MRFTKAPQNTFRQLVSNAGVLLSDFDPENPTVADSAILAATSGGTTFQAVPDFGDAGEGIDNIPLNTKELKKLNYYTATLSGTFRTTTAGNIALQLGAADVSGDAITPRYDLHQDDFKDIWLVADYSDQNSEEKGGFIAIRLIDALSTGGFQLKTNDKGNGDMAFVFTAHYSINDQTKVPFEVYVHAGEQ